MSLDARPLDIAARFDLTGPDAVPFALPPVLTPHDFKKIAVIAYRSEVADIRLQTGDYVFFSLRKRWRRASARPVSDQEMQGLLPGIVGTSATADLAAGRERNTRFEVVPPDQRGARFGFRVNAVGSRAGDIESGTRITLRAIREEPPRLSELGVEDELAAALYQRGGGLMLVVGATGHGKSSLLAATARMILESDPDAALLTYESPIEFVLNGPSVKSAGPRAAQCQVGTHIESFVAGAVNVMRSASQVVIFGEIRTAEEARGTIDCALSGHVTYATLHAETVGEVFPRLISLFPPAEHGAVANKIVSSTRLIVAQKLVPTLDHRVAPVREYLVLDRPLRETLAAQPLETWAQLLRDEVERRGRSMRAGARALLDARRIDERTFRDAAGIVGEDTKHG